MKPVSLLYLEDDPTDVEAVQSTLADAELDCQITSVRKEEFRNALETCRCSGERPYDLILVGFALPEHDGLTALAWVQEACPHVPVIILSAAIGEEAAVEALQQGATDYVLKQRLFRLGPAVRRALAEAEQRRQRRNAERTFRLTRFSLDHCGDAVLWFDRDGRIVNVNETACRRLGYSRDELLVMQPHDFDPDYPADAWDDDWERIKRRGTAYLESRHRAKDGRTFPVEISANFVEFEGRQYVCAFARDITDRKRAEEALRRSEEQFRQFFQNHPEYCYMISPEGAVLDANRAALKALGYRKEELVGKPLETIYAPESRSRVKHLLPRWKETGRLKDEEMVVITKDGERRTVLLSADVVRDDDGAILHSVSVQRDITERKAAEQALRDEKEREQNYLDIVGVILVAVDAEGRVTLINRKGCAVLGRPEEEILGKNWFDIAIPQPQRDQVKHVFDMLIAGEIEPAEHYEDSILANSGEERIIAWHNTVLKDAAGNVVGTLSSGDDVTDRRRVEASRNRLAAILEATPDFVGTANNDRKTTYINRAGRQMLGLGGDEDVVGTEIEAWHPDWARKIIIEEAIPTAIRDGVWVGELALLSRDRGEIPVSQLILAPRDEAGAVEYLSIVARDISDRKRADKALQESEERHRALVETSPDAVTETDLDGRITYASPQALRLHACRRPEEMVGRAALELIADEEHDKAIANLQKTLETGVIRDVEYTFSRSDGTRFPGELSAALIRDARGNPKAFMAVTRDITERKRAEEALRKSEAKFRGLAERSPNMIFINQKGRIVYANERSVEVMGYAREELYAADFDFRTLIAPECLETVQSAFQRHLRGEEVEPYEYSLLAKDGRRIGAILMTRLIPYEEETAILGIALDITERKRMEDALRQSEEKFHNVFLSSPMGMHMYELQPDGRLVFVDANPAADEILGVDNRQFLEMDIEEAFPAAVRTEIPDRYRAAARDGTPWSMEQVFYRDDRLEGAFEVHAFQTSPGRMVAVFSDVSERKRTEEALRESEERFRGFAERSFDMIYITDPKGNITYLSPAAERIFGLKPEEMAGRHFSEFLVPSEVPRAMQLFAGRIRGEEHGAIPLEAVHKDGRRVFLELNAWPIMEDGAVTAVQGVIRDATERRQGEERLRRMETQLAHVARLSTLGELVAGIAHEVSQPLYCVVNFAKATKNVLAAEGEPKLDQLREWNEEIASAAHRAGQIIARLRNFARRRDIKRDRGNVNDVARESVELVAFEGRRRGVAVRLELSPEPITAHFDRVQIQQVLVNLLRNAFEAMEATTPGQREVAVRTAIVGQSIEVTVADHGPGLPADDLKIFDAFVTTKPDGLGMGLAISRTIVEAHGGKLWAAPNPQGGAAFRFTMPLT